MSEETPPPTETLAPLSLAAAAKASGISQVTLRKHLKAGRLPATKAGSGPHGATWAIDPAELAAFVGARYGTPIDLKGLPADTPQALPRDRVNTETATDLRRRLDETLEELGRYKALAAAAQDTNERVEAGLKERLAELQHERDAAQAKAEEAAAELARLRSRGFWARLFGGAG